jgi:hypothetical protein
MNNLNKVLNMEKFKGRIQVIWQSSTHACITDIMTGNIKVITLK